VAAEQRQTSSQSGANPFKIIVNGTSIGAFTPPQANAYYTDYGTTFTAASSSMPIEFIGTSTSSTSAVLLDNVRILPSPTGLLSITPQPATVTYGTATTTLTAVATFTAGTPPANALIFQVNGGSQTPGTCSISDTTQTCTLTYSTATLAAGTYTVNVSYDGDANNAASSASTTLTVSPATLTVMPTGGLSKTYGQTFSAFTGTVTGLQNSDAGTATYASSGASSTANVGSYDITSSFVFTSGSDANYSIVTNTATGGLTVTQAAPTVTATGNTCTYSTAACVGGGSVVGVNGEVLSPVTLTYSGTGATSFGPGTAAPVNAGTYIVTATFAGNTDYSSGASVTAALTINRAASTTVVTGGSYSYNGTAHGATVSVTGVGGISLTPAPTYSGSCTSAPVTVAQGSACTASYTYAGDSNHIGSSGSAPVSITPDAALSLQLSSTQLVYPGAANTTVCVASATSAAATGTVQIVNGLNALVTQNLQGNGCAYWYISPGLAAGSHTLVAFYFGDKNNHPEESGSVAVTVNPVPVNLSASCWNASFSYGANYQCTVSASSNAGAVQGAVSATYDGTLIKTVSLSGGNAQLSIAKPAAGAHTLAISYAAQGNFAGAGPQTFNFTVTPAPVNVVLTPSSWYSPAGSSLTFNATISSWSAGPPNATGIVSFYDGSALLATVPVSSNGGASYSTSALSAEAHTISAAYSDGTDYASGSASVTITLAP
jgi:hypothetical protein